MENQFFLLATVAMAALGTTSASTGSLRTRVEIRDLPSSGWEQTLNCLNVMKDTTQPNGVSKYGSDFRSYDYFIVKHAVAVYSTSSNQAAYTPGYMTFHRLLILEMENSFMAVVGVEYGTTAAITGLPYWDPARDGATGEWPLSSTQTSEKSIFSSVYFGAYNGDPASSNQLTNGPFSGWKIGTWAGVYTDPDYTSTIQAVYVGNPSSGKLRGKNNNVTTAGVVRMPSVHTTQLDGNEYLSWEQSDYDKCTDAASNPQWMDWQACQCNAMQSDKSLGLYTAPSSDSPYGWSRMTKAFNLWVPGTSQVTTNYKDSGKATPHWMRFQGPLKIGSYLRTYNSNHACSEPAFSSSETCPGDMADLATAPNDPAFFFFHANLDRMNLQWLSNLGWSRDSPNETQSFSSLNYPTNKNTWLAAAHSLGTADGAPITGAQDIALNAAVWEGTADANGRDGTTLDEVVSSGYPFKKGIISPADGEASCTGTACPTCAGLYTHRDVLLASFNGYLPYQYQDPNSDQSSDSDNFPLWAQILVIAVASILGVFLCALVIIFIKRYGCVFVSYHHDGDELSPRAKNHEFGINSLEEFGDNKFEDKTISNDSDDDNNRGSSRRGSGSSDGPKFGAKIPQMQMRGPADPSVNV